jgi:PAS domain S-box-containing protein
MKHHPRHDPSLELGKSPHGTHLSGVALLDRDLRFVAVDGDLAIIQGWAVREKIGQPFAEACPAISAVVEPLLRQVLATGEPLRDTELRAEVAPGRTGRWLVSYEPVRARSGTVLAVECFVRELDPAAPDTALATAQAALHHAAAQLAFQALILEQLNDAVIAVDSQGAISYWGPGAERLFGLAAGDAAGRPALDVLRPEWPHDPGFAATRDALLAGQLWRGEVVLRTAAGAPLSAEVSARAIVGSGGALVNYLSVIRDVTERRRAERSAAESQQLFQLITDACPDLIYIYDKVANRNVYANREVATILGYSAAEVQAMGPGFIPSTIHPEDLPGVLAFAERVAASLPGEVLEHEYRMRHADGSYRWLFGREVVLTREPDGRAGLLLGIAQDVTARRAAEAERAELQAREQAAVRRGDEAGALLDTLVRSAPIGIAVVDRELRYVQINERLAAINGLPAADHLGRRASELFPGRGERWEALWREVLATGAPVENLEISGPLRGADRHALVSYYPIRIGAGAPVFVGIIVSEITELKRAQAAMAAAMRAAQEERALLDTLLGQAPIGFDFVDRELRFVRVNEVLAANNGLPADDHIGRTVRDVLPDLADTVEPLLRQVLATGAPIIDLEVTGETPAQPGVQRIWRESLYPVPGPDGQVLGVGAIVTEITEHRRSSEERAHLLARAEAAAARTASLQAITAALAPALTPEQVSRVIVEEAARALGARSGALALLDPAGATLEVVHYLGYRDADVAGWRWPIETSEPLADSIRAGAPIFVRDRAEAERRYPGLAAARDGNPDRAWANLPLVSEGRALGALSLGFTTPQAFAAEDAAMLTTLAQQCAQALERARLYAAERRAREDAEQAVRERDELVALISHDLKNPLTVIQGQAQLLERRLSRGEGVEPQRMARGLAAIHQAASSMSGQIEELLDVAMIRAGRPLQLYRQEIDLVALARRLALLAQANTDRHSVRLTTGEQELLATLDGPRVERVLSNLISNALKYSAGGEVTITVAREDDGRGAWAVLSVADQGVGIPPEEQPRIFERFHRAANIAGTVKGTGLGLTSAARIVAQHGGTISLHSVEGEGSVFTVRLPLG